MEIFVVAIIYSFICAFVCVSIMHNRDRSPGAGFALGFFLGIFGIIIAVCLPDMKRDALRLAEVNAIAATAEAAAANARAAALSLDERSETKVCPMCAETIKAAAKICRYCRHEFAGEQLADRPAPRAHQI